MANRTEGILSQTVNQVAMIINGAPFIATEDEREGVEHHRNNTAWQIHFPALSITFEVQADDGGPLMGYYHDREAESEARALWDYLRGLKDKDRAELRENSEFPVLRDGFKIMTRILKVQPIE